LGGKHLVLRNDRTVEHLTDLGFLRSDGGKERRAGNGSPSKRQTGREVPIDVGWSAVERGLSPGASDIFRLLGARGVFTFRLLGDARDRMTSDVHREERPVAFWVIVENRTWVRGITPRLWPEQLDGCAVSIARTAILHVHGSDDTARTHNDLKIGRSC